MPVLPAVPALRQVVQLASGGRDLPTSAEVWLVEKSSEFETYSNGLRIENQYAVSHRPRAYAGVFTRLSGRRDGEKRSDPAGIVYHTTESFQAPFESSQNNLLKRVGESLIEYVRRRRCYNFLIDRFGRVFRIVNESDAADHAGHSVWADDRLFLRQSERQLHRSFIRGADRRPGRPGSPSEMRKSGQRPCLPKCCAAGIRSRVGTASRTPRSR